MPVFDNELVLLMRQPLKSQKSCPGTCFDPLQTKITLKPSETHLVVYQDHKNLRAPFDFFSQLHQTSPIAKKSGIEGIWAIEGFGQSVVHRWFLVVLVCFSSV